ncbi:cbb3-type cytochrome c oxidase subunit 3 [Oceanicaulis sp. MMSF_3324]|uniref:cbb3-type cytochrome c oxidase subunit 3 n=1 Tax=Oceanicaulis sp. MMSF_3324 TaxID=3046702 RepID=UPI00273EA383|nr:cbb3-type cytochrome c oxidase subunit 3 [Oceanicaulis sp. MMSF_3324]
MYETLSSFAQTWGLIGFVALFAGVLVYALWPKNQDKFDDAARVPLEDDARPDAASATEDKHG